MGLNMKVDKNLLPMKGHFFLFNAGTAPLVPYLSTYARQLGFSSTTVGLIYTVLPIFGLIAKPLFGVLADRFKIQKLVFIIFQVVTIVSFLSIYAIPESRPSLSVDLDCGEGVTVLRSCFQTSDHVDQCKVTSLEQTHGTTLCDMNCDMSSPKMWQTVCEHWHIPQYCYSNTDNIEYTAHVTNVTMKDKCAYIASDNVTLDGYTFTPHCRIGGGFVDINEPCRLNCTDEKLSSALGTQKANMTCSNETLNYRLCADDIQPWLDLANGSQSSNCKASCDLMKSSPWRLMEICEGWQADAAASCRPKTVVGGQFPANLSFVGAVKVDTIITEHECVYMQLNHIQLADGSTHYPNCISKSQYQMESQLFHTACEIKCNNSMVNELIHSSMESSRQRASSQYTTQFWLFFALMIISWVGQAVVVTFADAICFNLLGTKPSLYGKQRLWGSVGWGIFSLLTGALIDLYSDGAYKNYAVAFVLMFVFMIGDVIVSCFVKVESTKMSLNILADVGTLVSSMPTIVFMIWTIVVGMCTGLLWQFLFWHLEDISGLECTNGLEYVKTLQGLVSATQTFCGEIPFMFLSGYILKRLGHVNVMSLVLFAFGVRFLLYSFLMDPWWVLPIEMLQGITFGMFYPTMTSYANVISPPGTETTVQGLVGAVFEGVGTSLGSFIGGRLYETHGGWNTFRWFGFGALVLCILHIAVQWALKDRTRLIGLNQGYTSVIKYEQPNDMVYILEDMAPIPEGR